MSYVYVAPRPPLRERLAYQVRILRVISRSEFKLKYAGSLLGYAWSLGKPLLYFGVLWVVFSGIFKTTLHRFPLYLLLGIVLYTYMVDAVTATLPSIVVRAALLRRIAFPPLVIPLAATLTAAMTFAVNSIVVVAFIFINHVRPHPSWVLLIPLGIELYVFVVGISLIAATLYVRFRDVGHLWEVAASVLFFASPIMYPVTILPRWAQNIIAFNPFVQILQDVRRIVLGADANAVKLIGGHGNHVFPVAIAVALLAFGLWLHRRESPRFAELA
jgi:ABC-2 type transport system permease protein